MLILLSDTEAKSHLLPKAIRAILDRYFFDQIDTLTYTIDDDPNGIKLIK